MEGKNVGVDDVELSLLLAFLIVPIFSPQSRQSCVILQCFINDLASFIPNLVIFKTGMEKKEMISL